MTRAIGLLAIVLVAMAGLWWAWREPAPAAAVALPSMTKVTTAHQLGVVGYRDPAGVISPDGRRLAYSEGRFVKVVSIEGGEPKTMIGTGQIRYLAWVSNDTILAEDQGSDRRWRLMRLDDYEWQVLWETSDAPVDDLRQIAWRSDGKIAAAISMGKDGAQLWTLDSDGAVIESRAVKGRVSWPAFQSTTVACIVNARLTIPCGGAIQKLDPDVEVLGPIALTANRAYFASPDGGTGMVALWEADLAAKRARRVSTSSRDAYAPSIGGDRIVFKTQDYHTHLADAPASGGDTRRLTTFQSETPSYHPTQPLIAFTYGTWRRVLDDAKYPDIAQDIGVIDVSKALPAGEPASVIAQSESEDQAMAWSPNGKWIAFHTHREMSDDVWLRPGDGSQPDRRITFLGRGAEVGWPRWSPDGKRVLLEGARKSDGRSVLYTIGVDQVSGKTTSELNEVRAPGFDGEMGHAEWLGNDRVIAVVKEGPGRHAILTLPVSGGTPRVVHRYATEHDFSGLGVSPDGRFAAFAAPAADGYYQIFTIAIGGGAAAVQVTSDASHKTQPAWSPDGARIAFTVWNYDATFWTFTAR